MSRLFIFSSLSKSSSIIARGPCFFFWGGGSTSFPLYIFGSHFKHDFFFLCVWVWEGTWGHQKCMGVGACAPGPPPL